MRSAAGLADLVLLLRTLPPEQRDAAALLLGLRRAPESKKVDEGHGGETDQPPVEPKQPSQPPPPPPPEPDERMVFWRVEAASEQAPESARRAPEFDRRRVLSQADIDAMRGSLFELSPTPALAPWAAVWPRLYDRARDHREGRALDVDAIVRSIGRGEHAPRIPRVRRSGWASTVEVWVDRSSRLVPLWDDQDDIVARLIRLCGGAVVRRVILDPVEQERRAASCGDLVGEDPPAPGACVVVLGDLGLFGGGGTRERWRRTALRLRECGARVAAAVARDASQSPHELERLWCAFPWERTAMRCNAPGMSGVEQLLRLTAAAMLVQPGLLRALRRLLPAEVADVGTELAVWNHPDVAAADVSGMALSPDALSRWRARFANDPDVGEAQRASVRALIDAWRARAPRELAHAETLAWIASGVPGPSPGSVAEAEAMRDKLAARLCVGVEDDVFDESTEWARRLLASLTDDAYARMPALKPVWGVALAGAPDARRPGTIAPHEVYVRTPPRTVTRWAVGQRGASLCIEPQDAVAWPDGRHVGSPVGVVQALRPRVWVTHDGEVHSVGAEREVPLRERRGLTLSSDLTELRVAAWRREPWAVAAGRDRFGLWAEFEVNGARHRLRWIPPGTFAMGSPASERGRTGDEEPQWSERQHDVTLTRGYWLGETPVTQALWEAVTGANPSRFKGGDRPVEQVSWEECDAFCASLNAKVPGLFARLPTEAEWERACRGGTTGATWAGDLDYDDEGMTRSRTLDAIAWYGGNSGRETHTVGAKAANPYGLHDMLGNVWEWCQDWLGDYQATPATDPVGPGTGPYRVLRGGAWGNGAGLVRAAYRRAYVPSFRSASLGFRLAGGQESALQQGAGGTPRSGEETSTREASTSSVTSSPRERWAVTEGRDASGPWGVLELGRVRHRLRWIPPGTFQMGSPESERGRWEMEGPQHEVTLTRGYWLGETPVTQALWEAVTGSNPSTFQGADRPVEQVNWAECATFCASLNERVPGLFARLPTEAEWERACRGGTTGATWVGELDYEDEAMRRSHTLDAIAWYDGNSGGETHAVGGKAPNPYGLHDMLGNVMEWCQDWLGDYQAAPATDPVGPGTGAIRVFRGGAWRNVARLVRAAYRSANDPSSRLASLGFRLAGGQESALQQGAGRAPRSGEAQARGAGRDTVEASTRDAATPRRKATRKKR